MSDNNTNIIAAESTEVTVYMDNAGQYSGPLVLSTPYSAGYDIKANESSVIPPHSRQFINTKVKLGLKHGYYGKIEARSSMAKRGIDVGAGVIDSDYTDFIKVLLINNSNVPVQITKGDKCAQVIIQKHYSINKVKNIVTEVSGAHAGFGSTGN